MVQFNNIIIIVLSRVECYFPVAEKSVGGSCFAVPCCKSSVHFVCFVKFQHTFSGHSADIKVVVL